MRALLEDLRTGKVDLYEVPVPELRPGGVLVRTAFSAISAGTERATMELGKKSLFQKAMARPELVRQVADFARTNGIKAAYEKVQARLESLTPMGYSCAGTVLAAGAGVTNLRPGDRVACAGVGYASHAEINFIPRNLAVRIPDGVSLDAAALTTIGAIAMQGVRQAQLAIGETVLVVGAGLVGVLAMQIARAAGCRVIALDRDPQRVARASEMGAHVAYETSAADLQARVRDFSRYGADAALLTAATPSAEPITLAAELLRDRGRIVVVGDVGMDVPRAPMYRKELSVYMSRSYGPGRYDPTYEEEGTDYPIGHVRWTERRNMEAFLDLLSSGAVTVAPLLQCCYAPEDGAGAYETIRQGGAYTVIIDYGQAAPRSKPKAQPITSARAAARGSLRLGCIGAGAFARSVIFPKLRIDDHLAMHAVATASGVAAESARRSFNFAYAMTPTELISCPDVDAVFILSQHDSHARYTVEAVYAGKPVFVEKPLATNHEELQRVRDAYDQVLGKGQEPFVMVGFNRRFAPASERLNEFFTGRSEPMMINIRINAGYLPLDHWAHQHGGRIIGEFCHFVDWARFIVGAAISSVTAVSLPDGTRYHHDNISAVFSFADGSVANLVYLANGDRSVHKEFFEVFCGGGIARLDDFRQLELCRNGKRQKFNFKQDKGHAREIEITTKAMRAGGPSPISFDELAEVTEATFAVQRALAAGVEISLGSQEQAVAAVQET